MKHTSKTKVIRVLNDNRVTLLHHYLDEIVKKNAINIEQLTVFFESRLNLHPDKMLNNYEHKND